MKKVEFIHKLAELDRKGVYVLSKRDIEQMFPEEDVKALEKSLQRLVVDKLLLRVAKGVYLNPYASSKNSRAIEQVAKALRPDSFSYISLESILSEYGVISQIPMSRITIMTTGAKGVFETPLGTIDFTHTKRSPDSLIGRTLHDERRPLRIAKKKAAVQDLYRVGRNTNMINQEELEEECH